MLKPGSLIDAKFRVVRFLGCGGMGHVYECHQADLDRIVAVKVFDSQPDDDQLRRFEQESRILSRIEDPHIVRVFTCGVWQSRPYLVMELIHGTGLNRVIEERPSGLAARLALRIAHQLCCALESAHARGVIHRDIKPSNVILCGESDDELQAKLIDFGLAKLFGPFSGQKLTQTGVAVGSVSYMSPEQCRGQAVDERSDVYGLGCLIYECLTGSPLFVAETAVGMMFKHLNEPPSCAERWHLLPASVEPVLVRCLEKNTKLRQPSMSALRQDLDELLSIPQDELNRPVGRQGRFSASRKRTAWGFKLAAAAVALSATVVTILWLVSPPSTDNDVSPSQSSAGVDADLFTTFSSAIDTAGLSEKHGKFQDAIKLYRRSFLLIPNDNSVSSKRMLYQSHIHLAWCLMQTKSIKDAMSECSKAVALSEDFGTNQEKADALDLKSTLLVRQGKAVEAIESAKKAFTFRQKELAAANSTTKFRVIREAAYTYGSLAHCYEMTGSFEKAEKLRLEALDLVRQQPHPEDLLNSLREMARYYINRGRLEKARTYMEEWFALEATLPSNAQYLGMERAKGYGTFAELIDASGDKNLALRYYRLAVSNAERYAMPKSDFLGMQYHHLCICEYAVGDVAGGDERDRLATVCLPPTDSKDNREFALARKSAREKSLTGNGQAAK